MKGRSYKFRNSVLTLQFGDIVKSEAEVIVSSDDDHLSMGGGVSKSILEAGGKEIYLDARKFVPCKVGDVVVTTAGRLGQKYVFHAVSRKFYSLPQPSKKDVDFVIKNSIRKCFEAASVLGISSIAFPSIGAGFSKYPIEQVSARMADEISDIMLNTSKSYNVAIYLYDRYHKMEDIDFVVFFQEFAKASTKIGPKHEIPFSQNALSRNSKAKAFISYARQDCLDSDGRIVSDNIVYKVREALEKAGVDSWMDSMGILSGEEFAGVITESIKACKALVFISSENSNKSENVTREICLAAQFHKPIIPLKIDDSEYNATTAYYLAPVNWIEYTRNPEKALKMMIDSIKEL